MLPGRDLLQFKARYRLRYSKAKEEDKEENLGGSGEVAMIDTLVDGVCNTQIIP